MKESVFYEELRPDQFVARINACPVAYLPLGTLEWHGRHLPLGADGLQARGVMAKIAERVGGIVLPMLFLGPDMTIEKNGKRYNGMDILSFDEDCPQQLEGSAYWIGDDLFFAIIDATFSNLARVGFKAVVAHGHGPSTRQVAENRDVLGKQHGLAIHNLWELGLGGHDGIQTDHAGFNETSIVLGLDPDLVDLSALRRDGTPVGVAGRNPARATERTGAEIINLNVEMISEKLAGIVKTLDAPQRKIGYANVKNRIRD